MDSFVIRRATPADAATLSELAWRTFNDTFAGANTPADMAQHNQRTYSEERQRAEIVSPSVVTLIGERNGQAIAYAQLRSESVPASVAMRPTIELWRFYIDKPAIGHGMAQQLMDRVLADARASGAVSIWLGVWERNARALAFYRKSGYVEVGCQVFRLGSDAQTDLIFERTLTI